MSRFDLLTFIFGFNFHSNLMLYTPNFLPCVAVWQEIFKSDQILLNVEDIYLKQSYRNRAQILSANKVHNLIIPVHASSGKTPILEVKIDNHSNWQRNHWRSIQAAYNQSLYFHYYDYLFEKLFTQKYDFLIDVIVESMECSLKSLQQKMPIVLAKAENDLVFNISGKEKSISEQTRNFRPYKQNFGDDFNPNLSILDLLCCLGPESLDYLKVLD